MSNEIKEKFQAAFSLPGVPLGDAVLEFLDQFDGYKLAKDGWQCEVCGDSNTGQWNIYKTYAGHPMKACKQCFDLLCPEPAAKPTEPEPWVELTDVISSMPLTSARRDMHSVVLDCLRLAWSTIERRVKKLIAEAIKAEREARERSIRGAIKNIGLEGIG